MEVIEKHLKYFTFYLGIVYCLGFLILSTRLSYLQIYIKDFLTLDYLKAGLLFFVVNVPLFLIGHQSTNPKIKRKKIFNFLIYLLGSFLWFAFLSTILFQHEIETSWALNGITFLVYPIIVAAIVFRTDNLQKDIKEKDVLGLGMFFVFILVLITSFSNVVFPQIQFRFGGGAPYQKTLYFKDNSGKINIIEARIYYENAEWVHYITDNTVKSIPKKNITKQESTLQNNYINKQFESK